MTLRTSSQSIVTTGTTPAPLTPASSDTLAGACFGVQGARMRVITTGTVTNVSVLDPNYTPQSNPGTVAPVACPATGVREILVPNSAVNTSTGVATVNFSSVTGVTYELYSL